MYVRLLIQASFMHYCLLKSFAVIFSVAKVVLHLHTDCPATLSTLSEGYYSGVGGPTGQVVVHSGRGRFAISFEVSWPHLS